MRSTVAHKLSVVTDNELAHARAFLARCGPLLVIAAIAVARR
jgi:hypothetical protein